VQCELVLDLFLFFNVTFKFTLFFWHSSPPTLQATRLVLTSANDGSLKLARTMPHSHGRVTHGEWTFQRFKPDAPSQGAVRDEGVQAGITDAWAVKAHTRTFVVMRTTATLTAAAEDRAR
jgi:hypothetical protein